VVKDLESDSKATLNPDVPFMAASTAKLITAARFLSQVGEGKDSLDSKLGSYTAEYQLEQMINRSNNDSWAVLNAKYSLESQQAYAASIGLTNSHFERTESTANDLAVFLEKLYDRQLFNEELSTQLLSYMQETNEESYIPAALPSVATVYHKYGILGSNVHDAAIIEYKGRRFILVIMSKGSTPDYAARQDIFQTITKDVLNKID
jgi:beta-lactamase class A